MACVYAHDFGPTVWQRCGPETRMGWGTQFTLSMLPLLARLVQSVRRYVDSNLITHLINVSSLVDWVPNATGGRKDGFVDSFPRAVREGNMELALFIISSTIFGVSTVRASRAVTFPSL